MCIRLDFLSTTLDTVVDPGPNSKIGANVLRLLHLDIMPPGKMGTSKPSNRLPFSSTSPYGADDIGEHALQMKKPRGVILYLQRIPICGFLARSLETSEGSTTNSTRPCSWSRRIGDGSGRANQTRRCILYVSYNIARN